MELATQISRLGLKRGTDRLTAAQEAPDTLDRGWPRVSFSYDRELGLRYRERAPEGRWGARAQPGV